MSKDMFSEEEEEEVFLTEDETLAAMQELVVLEVLFIQLSCGPVISIPPGCGHFRSASGPC